jgi:hypothetical protein
MDGSSPMVLASGIPHLSYVDITVHEASGVIYWITLDTIGAGGIKRRDVDGSVTTVFPGPGGNSFAGITVDEQASVVFFGFAGPGGIWEIRRMGLNGESPGTVFSMGRQQVAPLGMDVVPGGPNQSTLYWAEWTLSEGFIVRGDVPFGFEAVREGSNRQVIVSGLNRPADVVVHSESGKVYWVDSLDHKVQWANLDGSNVATIAESEYPTSIAIDKSSGKLLWVNVYGQVRRSNLDGSSVEDAFIRDGTSQLDVDPTGTVGVESKSWGEAKGHYR